MKNRILILQLLILLYGASTGFALKCHQCVNLQAVDCLYIDGTNDKRFLAECPPEDVMCVMEKTEVPSLLIKRKCAPITWSYNGKYHICNTDGCNYKNEGFEEPALNSSLKPSMLELVIANIDKIGIICLIVFLVLVYCGIKCCQKDKDDDDYGYDDDDEDDYDSEDYDDDEEKQEFDDDYDDDSDYDDEYDSDPIGKEYDNYAKDAKAAYEQTKLETAKYRY